MEFKLFYSKVFTLGGALSQKLWKKGMNVIKVILKSVCVSDSDNKVAQSGSSLSFRYISVWRWHVCGTYYPVNNIGRQLQNGSFILIMSKREDLQTIGNSKRKSKFSLRYFTQTIVQNAPTTIANMPSYRFKGGLV